MAKQSTVDFFSVMEGAGVEIPQEYRGKIEDKIRRVLGYEPKIGVFGKTGVGKSSLCNAVFGRDVCPISDVEACTRRPQEVVISIGGSGLKLVDVPGVGESRDRDVEYAALYSKLLPELDLVIWVLKGDDRAFTSDETFYKEIVHPHVDAGRPFFFVVNQADKIEPFREWNVEARCPGPKQSINIEKKRQDISAIFDVSLDRIVAVSANERYGLVQLVDSIVHALPRDKKIVVLKQVATANRSEASVATAERGFFDEVVDFVASIGLGAAAKAIAKHAPKFIESAAKAIFKALKFW